MNSNPRFSLTGDLDRRAWPEQTDESLGAPNCHDRRDPTRINPFPDLDRRAPTAAAAATGEH